MQAVVVEMHRILSFEISRVFKCNEEMFCIRQKLLVKSRALTVGFMSISEYFFRLQMLICIAPCAKSERERAAAAIQTSKTE